MLKNKQMLTDKKASRQSKRIITKQQSQFQGDNIEDEFISQAPQGEEINIFGSVENVNKQKSANFKKYHLSECPDPAALDQQSIGDDYKLNSDLSLQDGVSDLINSQDNIG